MIKMYGKQIYLKNNTDSVVCSVVILKDIMLLDKWSIVLFIACDFLPIILGPNEKNFRI